MEKLRRAIGQAVEAASGASKTTTRRRVNVAERANIVVARNVGEDGATRHATAAQTSRIRQDEHGAVEETETTTHTG
jgi:hypothetical protein